MSEKSYKKLASDMMSQMGSATKKAFSFLTGGGEMGTLMRGLDWSNSPLGDPAGWPEPLKTTVELMINSKQPMWVAWGPELNLLYNDSYIPICGRRHPLMLGRAFRTVWSEALDDVEPLLRRALAGESVWFDDLHFVLERNGFPEDTWFSFSYSPVRDSGRIAGIFCAVTETTQQVVERMRAAFRIELADELRLMEDESHIKARVVELLGRHLRASCAGYAVVDDSGEYAEVETEWTDGSVPGGQGRRHRLQDYGVGYLARLNAPILRDGRLEGILYVLDIQPRVWSDAEEALILEVAERTASALERARAERNSTLLSAQRQLALDAANLGWWTYDVASGNCTFDRQYCAIFGVPAASTVQEAASLVHRDDVTRVWEAFSRALDPSSSGSYRATYRIQRRDGETRWVEAHGITSFEGEGSSRRAVQLVGTVADITARRNAEEEVKLEALRKDEFLAILGHELRNPMAAISNAVSVLQRANERKVEVPHHARLVDVMHRQLGQLGQLVDDLLDVGRIGTGKLRLNIQPGVLLASVVQSAIESCQPDIDVRRHHFEVSLPPDPIIIQGDVSRLTQVLTNLLNNAAKYTREPGRITLTATRDGDRALIEVTDTGIGMEAQGISRAFNLFTQVHDVQQHSEGGLGVGLSVAKTIVQLHGGDISIRSPGRNLGCTVQVSLPV